MHSSGDPVNQFELDRLSLNSSGSKSSESQLDLANLNANEWYSNTPDRDPREIGGKIVAFPEQTPEPELGQIVNFETPPRVENQPEAPAVNSKGNNPVEAALNLSYDKTTIKTTNRLSSQGVATVQHAISDFSHTGNAIDFYESIRGKGGMLDANLKQSYNRDLEDA